MIERTLPTTSRIRAGAQAPDVAKSPEASRSWIHERAPRLRSLLRERHRREQVWGWLSVVTLIICWDASSRLDERVSVPRPRLAHVVEADELMRPGSGLSVDL